MARTYRIGDVARRSGCSVETIRHYEKLGLLERPSRDPNGYRRYTEEDLRRVRFVRHGRALGLDLATIRELLALAQSPQADCRNTVNRIAQRHLAEIEARIAALACLAEELRAVIARCDGGPVAACRVLEALYEPGAVSGS